MVKKVVKLINLLTEPNYIFLYFLLILGLLLARNPFSQRTLISNLEPFPDTLHYIVPARNLVRGEPFRISRLGLEGYKPGVPPLYSLVLTPIYLLSQDARVYYIANMIFSMISFYIFFMIIKKVSKSIWIIFLGLFLYSTNFFLYWYPQWVMAENLLLPLFLGGVYLLLIETSRKNILLACFLTVSFYATKYAAAPLSLFYMFLYSFKIIFKKRNFNKMLVYFLLAVIFFFIPLQMYIFRVGGVNHFDYLIKIVFSIFPKAASTGVSSEEASEWISSYHLVNNFPKYLKATFGNMERFLWDYTPILPKYLAVLGYMGLLLGLLKKRLRFLSFSLLLLLFAQMLFVSTFYAVDMRYIYNAIPTLLIGVVIIFTVLYEFLRKRKLNNLFYTILMLIIGFYLFNNAIRIKNQIVLNLKYAETPWYYISVLRVNDYFEDKTFEEKPIVISPMVPFLFDFYGTGEYELLPLSNQQEFRNERDKIWGPGNYFDLHKLYKNKLKEGRDMYVSTYGLGNEAYLHKAFDDLSKEFKLIEVYNGCYELCKIYKVEPKNAKNH